MCVIMSKPANVAFPEESILKNCWDNNPDMGGFMYTLNKKVYIYKGFETWESFKKALDKAREKTGDNIPYVCHFRISTQGFNKECCQPFPLSSKMKNLKRLRTEANIGVAHNGIIGMTSDGSKEYSDTMKFITDYLVNIIRNFSWYKDERTVKLINNMIEGSRLAILDKNGQCILLGKGWEENNGCHYSNHTYAYKKVVYSTPQIGYSNGWWDDYVYSDEQRWADYWDKAKKPELKTKAKKSEFADEWADCYNYRTKLYDFDESFCPYSVEDDDRYCECCSNCRYCSYVNACKYATK